jgi:hypothetical protein
LGHRRLVEPEVVVVLKGRRYRYGGEELLLFV